MILHLDGEPLFGRIERGPARNGPGLEHSAELEPQIVVQPSGSVLLNHETQVLGWRDIDRAARLRRLGEITLGAILREFSTAHPVLRS
jgi:hypothetical protein